MKHRLTYGLIWIMLLAGLPLKKSIAQEHHNQLISETAAICREELTLFTDRSFYVIHEDIHFTALLQTDAFPYNAPESSVMYLELISPEGISLAQGKYPVSDRVSNGILTIPASILSGTYYLRAYTRWMQNFGEAGFVYLPLRVINPFQAEAAQRIVSGSAGELLPMQMEEGKVNVHLNRNSYLTGEMVEVECTLQEGRDESIPFACLTVVPEGSIDTASLVHRVQSDSGASEEFRFRFLPDIGGIVLSGRVNRLGQQEAEAGVRVHFSMLGGENPAFLVTRSDSLGRFFVKIPKRFGIHEMFVTPDTHESDYMEVHIDHDFSTANLPFAPLPFDLDEKERSLGTRISLHMQLERAFRTGADSIPNKGQEARTTESFYGKAEISVKVGDFVNLPNLEEVIENLVPGIYVKQKKGAKYISIESANPMISYYAPLILVDNIPVADPAIVLAIPPSRIETIEVVPQVYVLGASRYGGIISIISRESDMAGIRLPESSYFFDFTSFHPPAVPSVPEPDEASNFPDTRNTIYWSDHAALPAGSSFSTTFRAPSIPGNYLILYRGISPRGKSVYGLSRFSTVSSINQEDVQQ